MLKLGIIGTSPISKELLKAADLSQDYHFTALYSRTKESAERFLTTYPETTIFTDLTAFLESDVDVIYIASPNALHFEQAKQALKARKHVIVEKPAFSNPFELEAIISLAKEMNCYFFEATRHIYEPAYATIQQFLASKTVIGANFSYAKYSSKMASYLNGEEPNIFSARYSGGALADLGVYLVYSAITLFGKPEKAYYQATLLDTGVDISGDGQLIYPDFRVAIKTGKNFDTYSPAEIYTTDGTLLLNHIQDITSAEFIDHKGERTQLPITTRPHQMLDELLYFAHLIQENDHTSYQQTLDQARQVSHTLYQMRQDAAIRFEADPL